MRLVYLLLLTLLCLAYREDVTGNTLPILTICKSLNNHLLTVLYTVSLFCAFISTAVSVVFGTIARFGKYSEKFNMNAKLWNAIVGIIIVAVSMFAASFGLTAIVAVGYGYLGVIGIFLVAIPTLILFTNFWGMNITFFQDKLQHWGGNHSPFILITSICLLNIFQKINFHNKTINFISSLSLLIYIFHENYFVRTYLRPNIWIYIYKNYGYDNVVLINLLISIFIFVISIFVSILYKVLWR